MVDHPCKGMTKAQVRDFELIAINQPPIGGAKTVAKLIERGIVSRGPSKQIGRDSFGDFSIPQYEIPLHVHWQWCEWCAENVPDEI